MEARERERGLDLRPGSDFLKAVPDWFSTIGPGLAGRRSQRKKDLEGLQYKEFLVPTEHPHRNPYGSLLGSPHKGFPNVENYPTEASLALGQECRSPLLVSSKIRPWSLPRHRGVEFLVLRFKIIYCTIYKF